MKKLIYAALVLMGTSSYALECTGAGGFGISVDSTGNGELSTPQESISLKNVNGSGNYYFASVNEGNVRTFTLSVSPGDLASTLKLIYKRGAPQSVEVTCK
ncbi:hypothetical protein [Bacteriovorax sp. Seq25_V]|uniref:hypothetical protein n=1 Tax=Bacteriovorax sp. Seq25_V TaxID=1201288 RepID=UPI00038A405F|nr:hypothetical protein [Bacteriovorax sp. Seq25_V]EQC46895.1 hypothetical protein M900_2653 [Bacteriovorax sp. Seq25_V]